MVSITLTVSTIAAITFTGTLLADEGRTPPRRGSRVRSMPSWPVSTTYGGILNWCVHHRKTIFTGAIALFFGTLVGLGPKLSTEFFPVQDNARIGVTIQLPVGTAQEITRDLALEISDRFREAFPEIITV